MDYKYRLKRFLILSVIGLLLGGAIAALSLVMDKAKNDNTQITSMVAPNIGGAFTLVNQDGKTVTDKDFAGKYLLIYFGFASCPAICPTELQKIAVAYDALPKDIQAKVQPLFITIDPERDTPAVLKNYVDLFMPQLIGLTGSVDQIEAVKKAYKVYGAKVPEGDSYTMDHSSFIYLMGRDGKPLSMFKASDTADKITKQIVSLKD